MRIYLKTSYNMCIIRLEDIMKQYQRYPDAGTALYDAIVRNIDDDQIIIDAENIRGIPTLMLNTSIGRLIAEFGYPRIQGRIRFRHIGKSDSETLKKYISHYISKTS